MAGLYVRLRYRAIEHPLAHRSYAAEPALAKGVWWMIGFETVLAWVSRVYHSETFMKLLKEVNNSAWEVSLARVNDEYWTRYRNGRKHAVRHGV